MLKFLLTLAGCLVSVFAFWVGRLTYVSVPPPPAVLELVDAFPFKFGLILKPPLCRDANAEERRSFELAAEVIEHAVNAYGTGSMSIGAAKLLGDGLYRHEGERTFAICPPNDIYLRVFTALDSNPRMMGGRPVEYTLNLISLLPQRNMRLAKQVADTAFNPHPQQAEILTWRDIRPFARTVLAGLGPLAMPWRDQAFAAISGDDSLGTGAAQIAVATRHPEALRRVVELMENMLRSVPRDQVINRDMRRRLKELAYAISLAGDEARRHLEPIKAVMRRKVLSWERQYGDTPLDPDEMCEILFLIEGRQSATALEHPYCHKVGK